MPKTVATLIRRSPLTETSLIVHWCSHEFGLLKTVAKGARRPRSAFAGKLDLFFRAEIEFVRSRKSDLHILADLALLDSRGGIRQSYPATLAAAYFVKLIERVTEPETPITEIARLLDRALDYLHTTPPDLRAVRHFESELARILGLAPQSSHAAAADPAATIARTFGDLPPQRRTLLAALKP